MNFKSLVFGAAATAAMTIAAPSWADIYPDFTVKPSTYGGPATNFVADKITGNYTEVITFDPAGTFAFSLLFNAGQFVANDGTTALAAGDTGLGVNYNLYARFKGTGTFSTTAGVTTFSLNKGGALSVLIDSPRNDNFVGATAPATGSGDFTIPGSGDDTLIATGAGLFGNGNINCNIGSNNCGSFGQTTSFNLLNPAGTNYFIQPIPFYNLSLQSGQFNGFTPSGTLTLNGSMDVIFATAPEPSTLALVGLALVGAGAVARRRKS